MRGEQTPAPASKPAGDWTNWDNFRVLTITVDGDKNENMLLVPLTAQAGYPLLHNEAVYLQDMKPYHLRGLSGARTGRLRCRAPA